MTRKSHKAKRVPMTKAIGLIVVTAVIFVVAECALAHHNKTHHALDGDLTAVVTNDTIPQHIIEYRGMTVSFNPLHHVPNWVAYELTAAEVDGTEPRYNKFAADPSVPGCATPDDYKHTGYDRGHIAPAADMKWDEQAMRESFLMTNIAPQAQSLNRGSWGKLERKCRQRADVDSAIIIVAGPVLTTPAVAHIGANGVTVPSHFFKVILSPHADPPCAIGFIFPNGTTVGGMQECAVTVDSVERLTGHDFFGALPDDIEREVESTCNFHRWSRML